MSWLVTSGRGMRYFVCTQKLHFQNIKSRPMRNITGECELYYSPRKIEFFSPLNCLSLNQNKKTQFNQTIHKIAYIKYNSIHAPIQQFKAHFVQSIKTNKKLGCTPPTPCFKHVLAQACSPFHPHCLSA